ncbi:hypothetical protein B0H13DRAFT_2519091 [Mycena leptocephala]|nr:hypothetical protein B0H13DRAFT_2519091 [Mycena leptocephala]
MKSTIPETRTNSSVSISSGITLVINTQGPGPFLFNINLAGGTMPEGLSFTVNAAGEHSGDSSGIIVPACTRGADNIRSRQSSSTATPGQPRVQRPFLLPIPASASEVVPETPQSQLADLPTPLPDIQSQQVEVSNTPKSQLDDCDDTEYSMEEEHKKQMAADEPLATFSPNCQLVTPTRKRRLDRMDRTESIKRRCEEMKDEQ